MFRKTFSFGGLLLLAWAAVLVTPDSGLAQHHGGGGHGGGFHSGSFSHGSFNHGGFNHGSFNHGGFNHGGFNHGGLNHGGFSHGSFNHHGFDHHGFDHHGFDHHGFNHHGFNHGFNHGGGIWWYPRYYGDYGAGPYYYGSNPYDGYFYPNSYNTDSYDLSSPGYDSGYYGSYGDVTSSDTRALITVSVPTDAEIWFETSKMSLTGSVREYQSPPLTPGIRYTYEIRARWNENGREVTQTQQVGVAAGTRVSVRFPVQPTTASPGLSH
jgi:uncharacterized protein (TIGR03000 family)